MRAKGVSVAVAVLLMAPRMFAGEAELLAVLASDASRNDKITACQDLGRVATKNAIGALAKELGNPDLHHAARYALEMITDPAVENCFCDAVETLAGPLKLGVIQSMGNRGNARSVALLAKYLNEPDTKIRDAAAFSLGKLATPEAMAALKGHLGRFQQAAIAYVDGAAKCPDRAKVAAYCREVRLTKANVSSSTRLGAIRMEILMSGAEGLALWDESIAGDKNAVNAALRAVIDYPKDEAATRRFAAALAKVPAVQERLCTVLADRGDKAAVAPLIALAKGENASGTGARLSAAAALAQMNEPAAVPVLVELLKGTDAAIAAGAAKQIIGFPGKAADDAVMALLAEPDAKLWGKGIDLALQRRQVTAVPAIVKIVNGAAAGDKNAAYRALGELGRSEDVPLAIGMVEQAPESDAAIRALSTLCSRYLEPRKGKVVITSSRFGHFPENLFRDVTANTQKLVDDGSISIQATGRLCRWDGFSEDPAPGKNKTLRLTYTFDGKPMAVEFAENQSHMLGGLWLKPDVLAAIRKAYAGADGKRKAAFLKAIAGLGNAEALAIVRQAAGDPADAALKEQAIRMLAEWKGFDAMDDAAGFAQFAPNERLKILSMRGFLRQLDANFVMVPEAKLALLEEARTWATRDEERGSIEATIRQLRAEIDNAGFVTIFNGKDLTGWAEPATFWRVQDGVLVGESTVNNPVKGTQHLIYDKALGDFEVRLEYCLSKEANSGVQLRAARQSVGDSGYQADLDGSGGLPGFIYHPKQHLVGARGTKTILAADGKKTVTDLPSKADAGNLHRVENWNTYRVICKGRTITVYLNGVLINELTDERKEMLPEKGYITLQIHQGPPMKLQYRNIRLKEFK